MTGVDNEQVAADIAADLKGRFGWSVIDMVPIDKGWLNVKWKVATDCGPFFVKSYHPDRYKLHVRPERRSAIERTLHFQNGLSAAGVACPKVYDSDGQRILDTKSGLIYAVLDWVDGYTGQAGCLSGTQMFELGAATGRMHHWLRSIPPLDKPAWTPDKEAYLQEWEVNWDKARTANDAIVLEWLNRSQALVKAMDFRMFEECSPGWLHWDLWVDNILVRDRGLAGIVDFDRMTMAYQEIDVARAILSGALHNGELRMEAVQSFAEGYREHAELPSGTITRAFCMLYLIESIWWLRTDIRSQSELRGLLGRFIEEIHWIEDHWNTLSDRLDAV